MKLTEISRCFAGVIPSLVASADGSGMPNITYVSQVHLLDDTHVALSCQFFNKTRRNLDVNPNATVEVYDPVTFQAYRLRLRFLRSEKSGPLFETMAMRIQAIASHTGMQGVFRLIAADVFEVIRAEKVEGFIKSPQQAAPAEEVSVTGLRTELRGLQLVSERINRADDLETLLAAALDALDTYFAFAHTIVLLHDEAASRLVTIACRGYGGGVGAEVGMGEGLIGTAAKERKLVRITGLHEGLRYGRAVRRVVLSGGGKGTRPEIPLPGLSDAQSAIVIPLLVEDRLIGVLAAESRDPMAFGEWDEAYLDIIANQIALGIDRVSDADEPAAAEPPAMLPSAAPRLPVRARHTLTYYRDDDAVFLDNEYLIRNVPGRILWKLLESWKSEGRTIFTNRELRLDRSLGLPEVKDNLESRLILLKHRLREKCPGVQIAQAGRGRFALEIAAEIEMVER